jgi:DNA (cytosine-5)-methyltransferase 1
VTAIDTIDLFAGCGGWSEAAKALGIREFGIELDPWACATRRAAGHLTVRADVAKFSTRRLIGRILGLIGSPPCGTFSAAGKGEGVDDLPLLHQALDDLATGRDTRAQLAAACSDPRTPLVVEPLRYALELRPEWIALEQVPAVLPLWHHIAAILATLGYSTWTGVLNAADYGVPQTRKRAILIASRVRTAVPPEPTHYDPRKGVQLWGDPWVSMAEALGWAGPLAVRVVNTRGQRTTPGGNEFNPSGPSWALTEKTRSWVVRTSFGEPTRGAHEVDPFPSPSHAVTSKARSWTLRAGPQENATTRTLDQAAPTDADSIRISVQEAAVLQSFPIGYPWQGARTQQFLQVGNAWARQQESTGSRSWTATSARPMR